MTTIHVAVVCKLDVGTTLQPPTAQAGHVVHTALPGLAQLEAALAVQIFDAVVVHTPYLDQATFSQVADLTQAHPGTRWMVVADSYQPGQVAALVRAGVTGILVTTEMQTGLYHSVQSVLSGRVVISPVILKQLTSKTVLPSTA